MNANGLWRNVPNRPLLRFGTVSRGFKSLAPDQNPNSDVTDTFQKKGAPGSSSVPLLGGCLGKS